MACFGRSSYAETSFTSRHISRSSSRHSCGGNLTSCRSRCGGPDGTLAWTNRAPERIGLRFSSALLGDLGDTIEKRRAHASISNLGGQEDAAERRLGVDHVFEVYAPIMSADGKRALGAYEIYARPQHTESFIASGKRVIWIVVIAVFASLYAALALLVRKASWTIKRQAMTLRTRSRELMESYRRLEESSLEAIESLNATVDAKDPYTAGHSARVQGIALAVAEELGLPSDQLDAIRFGGLFHDIGKIAVHDSILTKPGALDSDEYAAIKRHPADGAEIVSHFSRLHDAVPIIRHHHERWDGQGYPDAPCGQRDSARSVHRRARGRLGRNDDGSSLPPRAERRRGGGRGAALPRDTVLPDNRGCVLRRLPAATGLVRAGHAARARHAGRAVPGGSHRLSCRLGA